LSVLDWVAVEHLRHVLVDDPSQHHKYPPWTQLQARALIALSLVGVVLGPAAFILARVQRLARRVLLADALAVLLIIIIPTLPFLELRTGGVIPVSVAPGTGERWLASDPESCPFEYLRTILGLAAQALLVTLIPFGCAAARYAARRGAPRARAWLTAGALLVPSLGACALAGLWLEPWRAVPRWSELYASSRGVMIGGGLLVALAAARGIDGRPSPSPPRRAPALVLFGIGLALYTASAGALWRLHGHVPPTPQPLTTPHPHDQMSRAWRLPRVRGPCLPVDFWEAWHIRRDQEGAHLHILFGDTRPLTPENVRAQLYEYPASYRRRGVMLLVDADVRVDSIAPSLDVLASAEVGRVAVAGVLVEPVQWIDDEVLAWDLCIIGNLRRDAMRTRSSAEDRTWGELLDDPSLLTGAVRDE
jgi:hypothetical protein